MGKISVGGIHHVTAIAEDAQRNVDFYTDVLGLRFVKKTVNQDDRSYFREPGAILFETASDDPGFAID
ncbi:MAG: VOC family protein, partial [Halofilum sp. (in: g-proteobacteria)]